jgi:hypothetical protein
MWNKEQRDIFKLLFGFVNPNQEVPRYPGQMYVPQLPQESPYFQLANQTAGQYQSRSQALLTALSGKPAYEINPEISANYFEQSIRPGMTREFRDVIIPGVKEAYAGPGYWGSARADAQANATEKFAENLMATKSGITYQDELMRRQSLENAANRQAGTALPAYEAMMSDVGTAGSYARMIKEQEVLSQYQRWLSGEEVDGVSPLQYNPFIQLAFQYLGLQPFGYGQQSSGSSRSQGFNFGFKWA